MIPVVDLSLLGALSAIWGAFKVIMSTIGKGLDWIAKQALSTMVGSKFWATAVFCGICGFLIGLFYFLIRVFGSAILELVTPNLQFGDDTFTIIGYMFPLDSFCDFLNLLLSLLTSYLVITQSQLVFNCLVKFYKLIAGAWKI